MTLVDTLNSEVLDLRDIPTPPTVNGGKGGLLFSFPFFLVKYPWVMVSESSFSLPKVS